MAKHRISVKAGTEKVGIPARQLLQDQKLGEPQIKCPLCETLVDIPSTLERDIKNLAQSLGSEDASILFTIHHPPSVPVSSSVRRVPVTDPERRLQMEDAWRKSKGL